MSNDKTKKDVNNKKTTSTKKSTSSNDKFKIFLKNLLKKLKVIFDKVKVVVLKFLKKHWDLILMNLVIFILSVFIVSLYVNRFNILMLLSGIIFTILPTAIITYIRPIKSKDIILSIPMLYILFLIFLDYCTIRELYGISALGIDKTPNYIDAIMVVFVFTLFEYITAFIVNKIKDKKVPKKKIKK